MVETVPGDEEGTPQMVSTVLPQVCFIPHTAAKSLTTFLASSRCKGEPDSGETWWTKTLGQQKPWGSGI